MDQASLRQLLEQVSAGAMSVDRALQELRHLPFEDLGFAKVDHHRDLRTGIGEMIYCPGKTPDQVREIARLRVGVQGRFWQREPTGPTPAALPKPCQNRAGIPLPVWSSSGRAPKRTQRLCVKWFETA